MVVTVSHKVTLGCIIAVLGMPQYIWNYLIAAIKT